MQSFTDLVETRDYIAAIPVVTSKFLTLSLGLTEDAAFEYALKPTDKRAVELLRVVLLA